MSHHAAFDRFNPLTAGTTVGEDDAKLVLSEWLQWARVPMTPLAPFATPLGPSCFYFYHTRTAGGTVTNMAQGFAWSIDTTGEVEGETARLLRLTEHVREARKRLLHQEFNYNEHGEFGSETVSLPLYRHMRDEWATTGHAPTEDAFVVGVVKRIMASGTGNIYDAQIEHDIMMLTSSIMHAGCAKDLMAYLSSDGHVSLEARVRLELGGQQKSGATTFAGGGGVS